MNIQDLGELCVSYKYHSELANRPQITCSSEANNVLRSIYSQDTIGLQEQFSVLYLNASNKVIGTYMGFLGALSATLVDHRIIIGIAVKLLANGVIVAHNHPSGTLKASEPDIKLTEKLKSALELLDVKLLDHIILSPSGEYMSFADDGLL